MQKYLFSLLSATALVTACSAPAIAADAVAPAADALYTAGNPFAGFYVGVNAGYASAGVSEAFDAYALAYNSDFYGFDGDGVADGDLTGYSVGAQAGANFVTDGGLLLGGEVSASLSSLSGLTQYDNDDFMNDYYCDCGVSYGDFQTTVQALADANAKIGFATDSLAIFATAGVALAEVSWEARIGGDSDDGYWNLRGTGSDVRQGWTVGAGVEVMAADNVSMGLSYKYADFGTLDTSSNDGLLGTNQAEPSNTYMADYDKSVSLTTQLVQLSLNYHF